MGHRDIKSFTPGHTGVTIVEFGCNQSMLLYHVTVLKEALIIKYKSRIYSSDAPGETLNEE